jgi:hypothetical protein
MAALQKRFNVEETELTNNFNFKEATRLILSEVNEKSLGESVDVYFVDINKSLGSLAIRKTEDNDQVDIYSADNKSLNTLKNYLESQTSFKLVEQEK